MSAKKKPVLTRFQRPSQVGSVFDRIAVATPIFFCSTHPNLPFFTGAAMELALLADRLLLALIFLVAGFSKLTDRAATRQAFLNFGVPLSLVAPLALFLPFAEIVAAACLVPVATAWWGAVLTLPLLLTFMAAISWNLARGKTPNCHCFGRLHSKPIGWPILVRCGTLAGATAFLIAQGHSHNGLSVFAGIERLSQRQPVLGIAGALLLTFAAIQGWVVFHLVRQNGRLLLRMDSLEAQIGLPTSDRPTNVSNAGLSVGRPAPAFELRDFAGEKVTLDSLCAIGHLIVLIFWNFNCSPCRRLLPDIVRWQRDYTSLFTVTLVTQGTLSASRIRATEGVSRILLQENREVAEAYQIRATPTALIVHPAGHIGSSSVSGAEAIIALVEQLVESLTGIAMQSALALAEPENKNEAHG